MMVPCGTKCFVCTGAYDKFILPIIHEGAVSFLDSSYFDDQLAFEMSNDNADGLVDILWTSPDWRKRIFGKKGVDKANCAAFFFQLVACGIIEFQWEGDSVVATVARDENDDKLYQNVLSWEGFMFRSTLQRSNTVTFVDLLKRFILKHGYFLLQNKLFGILLNLRCQDGT